MVINRITGIPGGSVDAFWDRFKFVYLPSWESMINEEAELLKLIGKAKGGMLGGRYSITSLMYNHVQSSGQARFEDDLLPDPSAPSYKQLSVISRSIYARIRITGHTNRAARIGKPGTFAIPSKEQMASARENHQLQKNRMLYTGNRQILAQAQVYASGGPTITLYDRDSRNSSANSKHKLGHHYLRENMDISIIPASGGNVDPDGDPNDAYATGPGTLRRRITNIDDSGAQPVVTVDSAFGTDWTANDDGALVVPWRSRKDSMGAVDAETDSDYAGILGLQDLVSDTTERTYLYGVSRASAAAQYIESIIKRNGGVVQAYNENEITLALDKLRNDRYVRKGGRVDKVLCHDSVRREHVQTIQSLRRFGATTKKRGWERQQFTAGDKSLDIHTDKDCEPGEMKLLDTKSFKMLREAKLYMVGGKPRFVADKDAEEVVLCESGQEICRAPRCNTRVLDIDYSTTGLI